MDGIAAGGAHWSSRRSGAAGHPRDSRSAFGVDYSRVVHSGSFRRLQGKTQILAIGEGDFHRTRLTHSMETAQIAEGIVERLERDGPPDAVAALPSRPLIRAIALAHDLGHPPFGHSGEVALDQAMQEHGGFEGNGQTLRILARLESYSDGFGADLTRRAMMGVLKYPVPYSALADATSPGSRAGPPKCYLDAEADVVDWLLDGLAEGDRARLTAPRCVGGRYRAVERSFDCSIMEAADDVAYGVHDLEDALALGLVARGRLAAGVSAELWGPFLRWLPTVGAAGTGARGPEGLMDDLAGGERSRKRTIGLLVHFFVSTIVVVVEDAYEERLLCRRARVGDDARPLLDALQRLVRTEVIASPAVRQLEYKGRMMVSRVMDAFRSAPGELLPREVAERCDARDGGMRAICDHVASMSDAALVRMYERLFSPRVGTVFDRL